MSTDMKVAIVYNELKYVLKRKSLIQALRQRGNEVVSLAPSDETRESVKQLGVGCVDIPMEQSNVSLIADFRYLVRLRRFLMRERPDVVMLYTIKAVLGGCLVCAASRVPRVISIISGLGSMFTPSDNPARDRVKQFIGILLYRCVLWRSDWVFFQNPDDLELLVAKNAVKRERAVRVNGSGVDLELFRPDDGYNFIKRWSGLRFLFLSRIFREKGIYEFVESAKRIGSRDGTVEYWVAGPATGRHSEEVLEYLRAHERSGTIRYLGESRDVPLLLRQTDVYVLPTFYREGIPRTVLEAMAMGRPVITTDVPGCREAVRNGINGFLVEARNVDALVRAMTRFIKEPELVRKLGENSRRMAEARFDQDEVDRTYLSKICHYS